MKVCDCLPTVTEDTNLCSGKLEIRKIFHVSCSTFFAQSPINLLIFFLWVLVGWGFFVRFFLNIFKMFFLFFTVSKCYRFVLMAYLLLPSVLTFFFLKKKKNILMCGSMPCFKHILKNMCNSVIQNTPFHECWTKLIWQLYCLPLSFVCWKLERFPSSYPLIIFRKLFIESANNLPNYILFSIFVLILQEASATCNFCKAEVAKYHVNSPSSFLQSMCVHCRQTYPFGK